ASVKQQLNGQLPLQYRLPAAPDGHHWVLPKRGQPYSKRNPGYQGERLDYDHESQQFYVKRNETTPGSNRFKAEFAEARGYEWAIAKGHKPVAGFKRPKYGEQGLDSLFLHANPPPKYFIAEMKYHKSTYGWTRDGKQMSERWIWAKLPNQVPPDVLEDIMLEGFERGGLRYMPDLDKMIPEKITW
ncbi:MAG: hypothetical protein P8X79_20675, partial [Reinekea sp.]